MRPSAVRNSKPFVVAGELRPVDISMQVSVEIVVAGHLVPLAAFLVEPHP